MLIQFLVNGIITGMIYGLVALGFAMVYNTTRIFHIAYAAIYMIAPYFLLYFMNTIEISIYLSVFFALIGTILVGLLIELLVYRPLVRKNSSSNVIIVSSIGAMIILINLVALIFGNQTQTIKPGISQSITFGSILVTNTQLMQLVVSIAIIVAFSLILKFSRLGLKTRAYRDDKNLAEITGINTIWLKRIMFTLSSLFAAVASCLMAADVGMNPYIGMPMLLNAVVALIIGGVGRFHTPVLGGLLLGILQAMVIYLSSARWQDAVTFSLLIIFLLLRPQGILGEKMRSV